ncbi:hypothetical protein DOTSEDRAFT_166748 [Dothistroma septosporum NZE10]|uniref:Zinc finger PHD-type domain-containing protein n=1 Tax=Dothistroma septosporum (strain NZE10 / CBS 128990) TaxID=675120 RepID=N1PYV6_DOTSN|nr:hypothetical protein DOTSEDRAFT_166748 [Dothistroma septosporum NZE10]
MDFDQTYNSAVEWNFPSPIATPTAANCQQHAYHTPKTATFQSHFNDAFSTPQIPGYATPQQPAYGNMTPFQGQQQMASNMLRDNYYGNMQANGSMVHYPSMPPPTQAGAQPAMLSPVYGYSNGPQAPPRAAMSFDTSQMQTPPPTRGTSVKKPRPSQFVAFGTPSTIASRRFASPPQVPATAQQPQTQPQVTMQFSQLQFSPQAFHFGNLGPQSAPVYPQTQIMWEQNPSPAMYSQQPPRLDDPFAPTTSESMRWPAQPMQTSTTQAVSFNTPAMASFPVQLPMERPVSAAPGATSQQAPPFSVMTTASVDPSLVYSSPIRPVTASSTKPSMPRSTAPKAETKRKDSGNAEHKRTETTSSVDTASTTSTTSKGLGRSNTTGTTRPRSAPRANSTESLTRSNSMLETPRTASPLKRVGRLPLGSISESKRNTPRASVILTVDESGRARTVTQCMPTLTPSKSMLDKYQERFPGLFDSDTSDEDEDDDDETPCRGASFSFARGEQRKPKVAKIDPPVEDLEGLSIPRSSSSASMTVTPSRAAIAAAAQLRRGNSLRRQTPSRNGQRRAGNATVPTFDTAPMDISDRQQSVLGAQNPSLSPEWPEIALDAHNRKWSIMSMEQQHSVSPVHRYPGNPYAQHELLHAAQPDRLLVRCVCGVPHADRGTALVQCASCTQHTHATCVGLNPHSLPPMFTCFLCTRPASGLKVKVGSRT